MQQEALEGIKLAVCAVALAVFAVAVMALL
ncbi:hypothetical protein DOQ08_00240 [Marinobacter litoralis]|uniref:YnhF family membrane protein n=1 Tax=Marinobacter litoralis TaxID=187981 RepID=A0A3M2RJR2_9GAMM|nr:hypothetical protein DOQ08_00240 [Marinobacter litoralis]